MNRRSWLYLAASTLVVAVVPNLVSLYLFSFDFQVRAAVDLDYALLAVAVPFVPLWISTPGLIAILAADVLSTLAYRFQYPPSYLLSLGVLTLESRIGWVLLLAAPVGAFALLRLAQPGWRALSLGNRRRWAAVLLAVAGAVAAVDLAGRGVGRDGVQAHFFGRNLATSGFWRSITLERNLGVDTPRTNPAVPSAAAEVLARAPAWTGPIVLVVVESWGSFALSQDDAFVTAPLDVPGVQARYRVIRGGVHYHGATSEAELRELCSVQMNYREALRLPLREETAALAHRCLPAVLDRRGYRSVAFHGFLPIYYQRPEWYAAVGFREMHFLGDPTFRASRWCGTAFRGVCDEDALAAVGRRLRKDTGSGNVFLYLVTLGTHLPVDEAMASSTPRSCTGTPSTSADVQVCALALKVGQLLATVAQVAAADAVRDAIWIVVGDHPPPFLGEAGKRLYAHDQVPFVALLPRSMPEAAALDSR